MSLNIQEAHAFSTVDGFSLDVFVVDGWPHEVWSVRKLYDKFIIYFMMEHLLRHGVQFSLSVVLATTGIVVPFCIFEYDPGFVCLLI